MNYKVSIHLPNFSKFILFSILLSACSVTPLTEEQLEAKQIEKIRHRYASKYEWAVQHFEVGEYELALKGMKELDKDGAVVALFQNIPYYLGMSYSHLNDQANAIVQLKRLLKTNSDPLLEQDAEINLLFLFEKQKSWSELNSLAAELDKKNLYQNNRILVKLLWANSLLEQGELLGGKEILSNAESLLNNQPPESADQDLGKEDSNLDLWGRYHFTELKYSLRSCNALEAQARKKNIPLYAGWLDATESCFSKSMHLLVDRLAKPESSWLLSASQLTFSGLETHSEKIRTLLGNSKLPLKVRHELETKIRENFYGFLHLLEQSNLNFENQGLTREPLKQLQRQVDHLIYSLALPSSASTSLEEKAK
jgi:hypothetical protein